MPRSTTPGRRPRVKAVLLCAGLGSRLRPITDTTPKCLLPVAGRPLMNYWFDNLTEAGIDEIVVNTHWLPSLVEAFLEARVGQLPHVKVLHEPELLGSGGTLGECADWAADSDIVVSLYGDLLVTQKISSVVDFHRSHDFPFTLAVAPQDEPWRRGIATVNDEGVVVEFIEKPAHPTSNLAGVGMYAMSPSVLREIAEMQHIAGRPLDLGGDVLPRMVNRMKAYYADGIVLDIGTHEAYQQAEMLAETHRLIFPTPSTLPIA